MSKGLVFGASPIVSPYGSPAPPSVLKDASRFKNDGTFFNHTNWTQLPTGLWANGLDGINDAISLTRLISFADNTPWSLSIWIKNTGDFWWDIIISGQTSDKYLMFHNGNALMFRNAALSYITISGITVSSAYRHYAFSVNGAGIMTVHINGVYSNAVDVVDSQVSFSMIGGDTGNVKYIGGLLSLLKIYSYALSADQISRIFESERRWFNV